MKQRTMRFIFLLTSSWLLVGLSGCISLGGGGERDSGPSRPVDLSHVQNAVPKIEKRTIAGNKTPYTVLGKTYTVMMGVKNYEKQGVASWYGRKFHGRNTANGEVYDMYAMTAAHKSLPIPSYVRVTNLDNRKQVVVRVNDRGPFHGERIIDLSYAAASKLGFAGKGTARVNVELINLEAPKNRQSKILTASLAPINKAGSKKSSSEPANKYVQVGAFSNKASANSLQEKLSALVNYPIFIESANQLYKVRVGPILDEIEVVHIQQIMADHRLGVPHVVNE